VSDAAGTGGRAAAPHRHAGAPWPRCGAGRPDPGRPPGRTPAPPGSPHALRPGWSLFLTIAAQHLARRAASVAPGDVLAAAVGLGAFAAWALALALLAP